MTAPDKIVTALWVPTQAAFDAFARLSGDDNLIHTDPAFAARSRFGRTVSHGMLIWTQLAALVAQAEPGRRIVAQRIVFPNPTHAGDVVTLTAARIAEGVWQLRATVADRVVTEGEARMA